MACFYPVRVHPFELVLEGNFFGRLKGDAGVFKFNISTAGRELDGVIEAERAGLGLVLRLVELVLSTIKKRERAI